MPINLGIAFNEEGIRIFKNICEICGQKATAGIIDANEQIKIRYSCQDHYLQVYKKIKDQMNKKE